MIDITQSHRYRNQKANLPWASHMTTNDSTNFPSIYCSTWWSDCHDGVEVVKYWWHPDAISPEQFRADIKKCLVEDVEAWLARDEDWHQFRYLTDRDEDTEYWPECLKQDVLEARMASLGYRKCKNLVFAALPIDNPTTPHDQEAEGWQDYLGTELYGRLAERNARSEAKSKARFKAERAAREKEELRKRLRT